MSLDEFKKLQSRKGPECWYGAASRTLSAKDLAALKEAQGSVEIQTRSIQRWLESRDIKVGAHSVARHRRHECECAK
jgi:hypothetical protein